MICRPCPCSAYKASILSHTAHLCVIAGLFPAGVGVQVAAHILNLLLQLLHRPRLQGQGVLVGGAESKTAASHTMVRVLLVLK